MRKFWLLGLTLLLAACASQRSSGDFTKPEERLPPTDRVIRQIPTGTGGDAAYPQPEYDGVEYDFMVPNERTEEMQSTATQRSNEDKVAHGEVIGKDGQPLSPEAMEKLERGCTVFKRKSGEEYACFGCTETHCAEADWRWEEMDPAEARAMGHLCGWGAEGCTLVSLPQPTHDESLIIKKAVQLLAGELNRSADDISFLSLEKAEWSDSCLDAGQPGSTCTPMVVPGLRIYLTVGPVLYEYHSDATGQTMLRKVLYR